MDFIESNVRVLTPILLCAVAFASDETRRDPGFEHFYNLEYDQALAAFTAQAEADPSCPDAYNHIAETILFREMFRAGELGSDLIAANSFLRRPKLALNASDRARFSEASDKAIALAHAELQANPKDPAALYALGVGYAIRAHYNFVVRKAWLDALSDASAARKAHARAMDLDPDLIDAQLIPGVHEYIVGSLPWPWRMLGAVAGFSGDRERGIQAIRTVAEKGRANRYDAAALLAAIDRREQRPREAIPLLRELIGRFPRAYLLRLELAEVYGDLRDRASASRELDEAENLKRSGAPGFDRLPEARIHYARGSLLFRFGETDSALEELHAATAGARELDPATAASAWLRAGKIYDLKSRRPEALQAYREARRTAPDSEAASRAKNYIKIPYKRER